MPHIRATATVSINTLTADLLSVPDVNLARDVSVMPHSPATLTLRCCALVPDGESPTTTHSRALAHLREYAFLSGVSATIIADAEDADDPHAGMALGDILDAAVHVYRDSDVVARLTREYDASLADEFDRALVDVRAAPPLHKHPVLAAMQHVADATPDTGEGGRWHMRSDLVHDILRDYDGADTPEVIRGYKDGWTPDMIRASNIRGAAVATSGWLQEDAPQG